MCRVLGHVWSLSRALATSVFDFTLINDIISCISHPHQIHGCMYRDLHLDDLFQKLRHWHVDYLLDDTIRDAPLRSTSTTVRSIVAIIRNSSRDAFKGDVLDVFNNSFPMTCERDNKTLLHRALLSPIVQYARALIRQICNKSLGLCIYLL